MGNRVMETPNLRGKTSPRQLIPRDARRSRKRALRLAAKPQKLAEPAQQPLQEAHVDDAQLPSRPVRRSWKQVLRMAPQIQEPAKPSEQRQPEPAPAVEVAQTVPSPAQPSRKQEVQLVAKVRKRVKPPKPAAATQQPEPEVQVDEVKPTPTDKLEDGVVEWGIKRQGGTGSGA